MRDAAGPSREDSAQFAEKLAPEDSARLGEELARLREELARLGVDPATIDELADHFATTVEARLAAGDTLEEAIATARGRLGDLGALAREHAKVASPFGARPPRTTAWIVAAAMLLWPWLVPIGNGLDTYLLGFGLLRTLAIAGLVLRLPQGAALVQGFAACELLVFLGSIDYLQIDVANLAGEISPRGLALAAIPAATCLLLATRFTAWRWAMVALGFLVPIGMFGIGGPLKPLIPVLWLIATTALVVRARGAALACGALAIVVVLEARASLSYLIALVERLGFEPWQPIDIAATIAAVAGSVLAAVVALRCDRSWGTIVDEIRPRRAPDAPA